MKKHLLSLAMLVGFAVAANAQFGVKAGVNIATIQEKYDATTYEDLKYSSAIGPVVGLTYAFNIADIITIQPELLYSQSGSSTTYNLLGTEVKNTRKLNYLEVPVAARVMFGDSDGVGFHIEAGPWLGYAFGGNYKSVSGSTTLADRDFTFDDEDYAKRINYGLLGGAGVHFNAFEINVRYNMGLNNLIDGDTNNANDNLPELRTRGIAATLGYRF